MKNTCVQNSKTMLNLKKVFCSPFPINSLPFSLLILALFRHGWRCINALAEVFVKQKLQRQKTAWMLFFAAFSLTTISCDLFTKPRDPNYIKKIDEEIAWANADKLKITVAMPSGLDWGFTPQQSAGCFDAKRPSERPRKGYSFNIEFTVNPGYGFIQWLAFYDSEYAQIQPQLTAGMEFEEAESYSLGKDKVEITGIEGTTHTGARAFIVTVKIKADITLVPFCSDRPQLDAQTNPPLNQVMSFPYGQTVILVFNMPVKIESISIPQTINIFGLDASTDTNRRGKPFNLHGLDGSLNPYFNISFPNEQNQNNPDLQAYTTRVQLTPKTDAELASGGLTGYSMGDLIDLNITVTVGPAIENEKGHSMSQAQTLSYRTDSSIVKIAYRAENIRANRTKINDLPSWLTTGEWFSNGDWGNPTIDRRFTNIDETSKTVYIQFTIPSLDGAEDFPANKITVLERLAYDIWHNRNEPIIETLPVSYNRSELDVFNNVYVIPHEIQTKDPGIIQILVLPWHDNDDDDKDIEPLAAADAVAEGRFIALAFDTIPPGMKQGISLFDIGINAPDNTSVSGGVTTYIFRKDGENSVNRTVTLNGLADIADNGGDGRMYTQAYNLPWTMEADLTGFQFQVRADNLVSGWENLYTGGTPANTWNFNAAALTTKDEAVDVEVQFKDSLGNESDWIPTNAKVMFSTAAIYTVYDLKAEVNEAGNTIEISWEKDGAYDYPEVTARRYYATSGGDMFEQETSYPLAASATSYALSVPLISKDKVRSGEEVSNVYGYEISITAHNTAGNATTGTIWIYNIPGMLTNSNEQIAIINEGISNEQIRELFEDDEITNIVLTSNILLSEWQPVDLSDKNFYGNGHTVTINSFVDDIDGKIDAADIGLFGVVNDALIRDLAVMYNDPAEIDGAASATNVGGIAGRALGNTEISNCIVRGVNAADTLTVTAKAETSLGGIVGYLANTAYLQNCRAALNIKLNSASNSAIYAGGVIGRGESTGVLKDINCVSAVELSKTAGSANYLGGIIGQSTVTSLETCVFSGSVTVPDTDTSTGVMYVGGLAGSFGSTSEITVSPEIKDSSVNGTVTYNSKKTAGESHIGGLVGYMAGYDSTYKATMNASHFNGLITVNESAANNGNSNYGGVVGYIGAYSSFSNGCYSGNNASISAAKAGTGEIHFGGFAGLVTNTGLNGCYSEATLAITSAPLVNNVYFGGLIGQLYNGTSPSNDYTIEKCYAKGNLSASANELINIGGLVGCVGYTTNNGSNNITISRCYASGKINALNTGNKLNNAGGLIGNGRSVSIEYCYALGDVTVNKTSTQSGENGHAGGLIGYLYNFSSPNKILSQCFASGIITTNVNNKSVSAFAGGVIGYIGSDSGSRITVNSLAALGAKVAITGGIGTPQPHRIIGTWWPTYLTLNGPWYANNAMLLAASGTYGVYVPGDPAPPSPDAYYGSTKENGEDAGLTAEFMTPLFWQNAPSDSTYPGLGFDPAYWDFNTVVSKGYPTLIGLGGQ